MAGDPGHVLGGCFLKPARQARVVLFVIRNRRKNELGIGFGGGLLQHGNRRRPYRANALAGFTPSDNPSESQPWQPIFVASALGRRQPPRDISLGAYIQHHPSAIRAFHPWDV